MIVISKKARKIIIPNTFYGRLVPAVFLRRLHRFAAEVETAEGRGTVHIPNSGRLQELLFPGNKVGLNFEGHAGRKTSYTLVAAETEAGWAFIDARLPNRILAKAWRKLPPLSVYDRVYPERTWGSSRFDLALKKDDSAETAWLEAKCVTLVQEGGGLFPDAPTERGRRHLLELAKLSTAGKKAFVLFFLQHPGGVSVQANAETDPKFAAAMAAAAQAGVAFHAYRVMPTEETVVLTEVPVLLPPE
ncbi:MAG TPA: DNA/RNA nuclease SfsA [Firmicutes bacterium]|nr:DNA/RNA nuclease SfsA [Bacillota bacterium]